ncbi:MAG: DUF502 domain-containing protein [Synergistales bacterium]|nr:DUF502 domain-containing protein [Synergistales bacterium]
MQKRDMTEDMELKKERVSFWKNLGKNFFTGIIVFLPLILLVLIVRFLVDTSIILGINLLGVTKSLELTILVFVLVIVVITYAGYKFRNREQWILTYLENLIVSIPYVGTWYKILKDLIASFSGTGGVEDKYLGVARIPLGNGYILGFVTNRQVLDGEIQVTVFMPTSPNPTSGIVLFFPEKDIQYLPISAERAFTRIISLGVKD